MTNQPPNSPEHLTTVGACRSAVAVHVTSRRRLRLRFATPRRVSFLRLGHIMRITHFKRLALIIVLQVVMELVCLFYFSSSPHRWIPFAVAGLLLPFIGYIAALDSAPLLTKWPLILKASVLTLSSLTLTIGGYIISAILYLWWMMDICQTSP